MYPHDFVGLSLPNMLFFNSTKSFNGKYLKSGFLNFINNKFTHLFNNTCEIIVYLFKIYLKLINLNFKKIIYSLNWI